MIEGTQLLAYAHLHKCIGLARTIHIRCARSIFARAITKYTAMYDVFIIYTVLANPSRFCPCAYITQKYHIVTVKCFSYICHLCSNSSCPCVSNLSNLFVCNVCGF